MLLLLPAALAQTLTATDFVPYYSYEGSLAVAGTVTVTTSGTAQTLVYSLSGTDISCAGGAGDAGDSCGVHVHSGTTCDVDVAGHYYDEETVFTDPWGSIAYIGGVGASAGAGTTDSVETGLTSFELVGRTLIVHGYDGGRIACALLTAPAPTSMPTPAPVAVDWKIPMDPNTLSVAAGTTVTFAWNNTHNVYEVPDVTAYDACDDETDATQITLMSVQTVDVAAPDAPTTRYYVCAVNDHCEEGQKVAITWAAAPMPAPVFSPTPAPTPALTTGAPTLGPTVAVVPDQTIVDIADSMPANFSTLVQLLQAADLVNTLSGSGPFHVFAPTNEAFAALGHTVDTLLKPENKKQLTKILLYHVVPGTVLPTGLVAGNVQTVEGSDIVVTLNPAMINDATVLQPDVSASNGVIHIIDTVLIRPDQTIVDIAVTMPDTLSTLVAALAAADLVETLSGDGPFTVFAPTNDAFAALPNGTLESLLQPENKDQLKKILTYHVVTTTALSADLVAGDVATVEGSNVVVSLDPVMINGASVVIPDVTAANGVIHVIDTVLLPPAASTDPPAPGPTAAPVSNIALTAAPVPSPTAQFVVIASQLVLAEVSANDATLEGVVKAALVATLSSISSTDDIVAFSVVASRRRRLQSTYTVSFSVRVAAATLATDVATELAAAAQSGALTTQLNIATDAASVSPPTAPAAANTYDTILAATAVAGAPTPYPTRLPTTRPTRPPTPQPTPRPTAKMGMEDEDGSEDQGEDAGEDQGEDEGEGGGTHAAGGGMAILAIAFAAFVGFLCIGGVVRSKLYARQDRSDRSWAEDMHGVSNPAGRDPWGRAETRGVEMASPTHGLRSYH